MKTRAAAKPELAMIAICAVETVNRQWDTFYRIFGRTNRDNETITGSRDRTFEIKEYYGLNFGPCKLTYAPDVTKLTFTRTLLQHRTILAAKQGTHAPSIIKISEAAATHDQVLTLEVDLTQTYGTRGYMPSKKKGELRWEWKKPAVVRFTGDITYQSLLEAHYNKTMGTFVCTTPWTRKYDIWVDAHYEGANNISWKVWTVKQYQPLTASPPLSAGSSFSMLLSTKVFTDLADNKVPADINAFPLFVLPFSTCYLTHYARADSEFTAAAFNTNY